MAVPSYSACSDARCSLTKTKSLFFSLRGRMRIEVPATLKGVMLFCKMAFKNESMLR